MGRAIDLFVTYRFLKLLTTPFEKQEAFKLGIIDKDGNRIKRPKSTLPAVTLATVEQKNAYTILHKLVFNIKKIFAKVPGLRTKLGTYAAALFLLKDTLKENLQDPKMLEKEFLKYLHENYEIENTIDEQVVGFGELLPKGEYVLINDISGKESEEMDLVARKGDKVFVTQDTAPIDTVLGLEIFPVIHDNTKETIYISLEDIKDA